VSVDGKCLVKMQYKTNFVWVEGFHQNKTVKYTFNNRRYQRSRQPCIPYSHLENVSISTVAIGQVVLVKSPNGYYYEARVMSTVSKKGMVTVRYALATISDNRVSIGSVYYSVRGSNYTRKTKYINPRWWDL